MTQEPEDFETSFTDSPVCPYCGYEVRDVFEIGSEVTDIYCGRCNKKYSIEQETSRIFTSFKTCQPGEAHPFGEWREVLGLEVRRCTICRFREARPMRKNNG